MTKIESLFIFFLVSVFSGITFGDKSTSSSAMSYRLDPVDSHVNLVSLSSPDKMIKVEIRRDSSGQLTWSVQRKQQTILAAVPKWSCIIDIFSKRLMEDANNE